MADVDPSDVFTNQVITEEDNDEIVIEEDDVEQCLEVSKPILDRLPKLIFVDEANIQQLRTVHTPVSTKIRTKNSNKTSASEKKFDCEICHKRSYKREKSFLNHMKSCSGAKGKCKFFLKEIESWFMTSYMFVIYFER